MFWKDHDRSAETLPKAEWREMDTAMTQSQSFTLHVWETPNRSKPDVLRNLWAYWTCIFCVEKPHKELWIPNRIESAPINLNQFIQNLPWRNEYARTGCAQIRARGDPRRMCRNMATKKNKVRMRKVLGGVLAGPAAWTSMVQALWKREHKIT